MAGARGKTSVREQRCTALALCFAGHLLLWDSQLLRQLRSCWRGSRLDSRVVALAQPAFLSIEGMTPLRSKRPPKQNFQEIYGHKLRGNWKRVRGRRTALLVDETSITLAHLRLIVQSLSGIRCLLVVRRLYCSALTAELWKDDLDDLRIQPVIMKPFEGGVENPNSLRLGMDAIEFCTKHQLECAAILAFYPDAVRVHEQMQKLDVTTYAVLTETMRFGGSPWKLLRDACTDILEVSEGSDFVRAKSGAKEQPEDPAPVLVRQYLTWLRFMGENEAEPDPTTIEHFACVNGLEDFRRAHGPAYAPLAEVLRTLHATFSEHPESHWRPRPPGSVCIAVLREEEPPPDDSFGKFLFGRPDPAQWPTSVQRYLVLDTSPSLVADALRGLGYLDDGFNANLEEAVELFLLWHSRRGLPSAQYFEYLLGHGYDLDARAYCLYRVFSSSEGPLTFRLPQEDLPTKELLISRDLLPKEMAANTGAVMAALSSALAIWGESPRRTYNMRIWQFQTGEQRRQNPF